MLPTKKLYILTGGNANVGMGHITRCLNIISKITDLFQDIYLVLQEPDKVPNQPNLSIITTIDPYGFILQHAYENDFVLIDKYNIDKEFVNNLRRKKIISVEVNDIPQDALGCDRLINHTPGIEIKDFPHLPETTFFVGADYLLLREPFINALHHTAPVKEPYGIVLGFGSTDPLQLNPKVALAALRVTDETVHIITSDSNTHIQALLNMAESESRISLHVNIGPEKMIQLIRNTKGCFFPASTMALEAMCCGTALVVGWFVENQSILAQKSAQLGLAINMGNLANANFATCIDNLLKIDRSNMAKKQHDLLDRANASQIREPFKDLKG